MSEQSTDTPQACCLCRDDQGEGRWLLCRDCRDKLTAQAERHAQTARPSQCAACDSPRPMGLYCPACRVRFRPSGRRCRPLAGSPARPESDVMGPETAGKPTT